MIAETVSQDDRRPAHSPREGRIRAAPRTWRTSSTRWSSRSTRRSRRSSQGRPPLALAASRIRKRPMGSFIFLGPTGVGKTLLAKALAKFMFGERRGARADRHVRVHGEAQRLAARRRASGLRRLRGGWPAHREDPPPPLRRRPLRRDREGPPRRLQHASPDHGGGQVDGQLRASRRLQERDPDPHVEHRLRHHQEQVVARLRQDGRRSHLRHDEEAAPRRPREGVPSRVHQPTRRRDHLQAAREWWT